MQNFRPTHLEINLDQLAVNYTELAKLSQNSFVCPMLKANAYGHGASSVGKMLQDLGCESAGVALFEEGIELRQSGLEKLDLYVFAPLTKKAVEAAIQYRLTPVLLSDGDLDVLQESMKGQADSIRVHLKLNFGMNRMGFGPEQARELIIKIQKLKNVRLSGLCTHFPKSEDLMHNKSGTSQKIDEFLDFCSAYEVEHLHALNSAALLGLHINEDKRIHKLGMRPGIAFYGAPPRLRPSFQLPIQEAMTLRTQIQHLQSVKKGQGVSYMGRWVAPEDSLIGVIPIGYADGLKRGLSGRIQARVDGELCPQVGTICMDYVMINLSAANLQKPLGAEVEILFPNLDQMKTQAWADLLDTIPYEIMTSMGSRLPRMYS